ncbi:MAG: hypothetical protein LWX07_06240 [Bacteroidetes bacterium]|nr:hypothetical protein [Bacteroidota bacterium]
MKKIYVLSFFFAFFFLAATGVSFSQVFWEELPQLVTVPLKSASNYDCYNACVCGDSATVLRTTNRGYNWTNVSRNGIPANISLVNIFLVSISPMHTILAAGYTGSNTFVYRTTNSGANWSQVFTQSNGFIDAIWLTNENSGFMLGDPVGGRWSLWKTSNGGANWDSTGMFLPASGSESGYNNSLWASGGYLWFGTNNSRVYYSTNNGSSWNFSSVSPETNTYSVWMGTAPYNLGYTSGNTLYKTTNAGVNWTKDTTAIGTGMITSFTGSNQLFNYIFYTRTGTIYYKLIFSNVWQVIYTAPAGNFTNLSIARSTVTFSGPGWIYGVRDNGRISRANTFIEGVRLISGKVPYDYSLSQNYPNPFNSSTKFTFDTRRLPEMVTGEIRGGNVKISVYDMLGREVEVMINKVLQPAVYEIVWDASRYSSGMYYYRMLVTNPNGGSVVYDKIKKMALIK